jgi:hypothetical protein
VDAAERGTADHENSFASAYETDRLVDLISKASRGN